MKDVVLVLPVLQYMHMVLVHVVVDATCRKDICGYSGCTVADFGHISFLYFTILFFFPNLHRGANISTVVLILAPRC